MPVISRQLDYAREQADGRFKCRVSGIDAKGRSYIHGPFGADSLVAAEAVRDGVVWDLAGQDFNDLLEWVQALNTVATFDLTDRDITEDQGEEFITRWFAEAAGEDAITVAWWLDDINTGLFNAITARIGYDGTQKSDITNRFTFLLVAEPWWDKTVEL